jgi:hypothetical protein
MKIRSRTLTTCGVTEDGKAVTLDFIDDTDASISLQLPFNQAEAVAMTLPRLLTRAVKALTGWASARYVFSLGKWAIEQAADEGVLIVTLETPDGFEVSFGLPPDACRSLASALACESDQLAGLDHAIDREPPLIRKQLN